MQTEEKNNKMQKMYFCKFPKNGNFVQNGNLLTKYENFEEIFFFEFWCLRREGSICDPASHALNFT